MQSEIRKNYLKTKRLFDMYGFATDFSAFAPDSIRYPPNATIPKGLVNAPKLKEKLSVEKIKKLFEIDSILLGVLPESFKSIEGGANAGLK